MLFSALLELLEPLELSEMLELSELLPPAALESLRPFLQLLAQPSVSQRPLLEMLVERQPALQEHP